MCTSGMFRSDPQIMTLLKYLKCIESAKEERIQSILIKPGCSLARLMPSSAIETVNTPATVSPCMKQNETQ